MISERLRLGLVRVCGWGALIACLAATGCAGAATSSSGGDETAGGDETSPGEGGGSSASGGGDLSGRKRVFITSVGYTGDLASVAGADSGLAAGDQLCALAAEAAGMDGAWKAWLSDAQTDAIDRIADVGPWYLTDRKTKVFNNRANLGTKPLVAIGLDENGQPVPQTGDTRVWTGTKNGGHKNGDGLTGHCDSWYSTESGVGTDLLGQVGDGGDGAFPEYWTETLILECYYTAHLYCFEQ